MSTAIKKEVPFDEACRFLIKLGEAAHAYGSTAARLEAYLTRMTAAFGLGGVFRSTPTDIVFAFQEEGDHWQHIHVERMPGTGLELNRLARAARRARQVQRDVLTAKLRRNASSVFGRDHIYIGKDLARAWREVGEIADRCGYDEEFSGCAHRLVIASLRCRARLAPPVARIAKISVDRSR